MSETINQRIKRIRRSKKISQAEIAKRLGMKTDTYSKYERIGKISCDKLSRIAEILETDVSVFMNNSCEGQVEATDGLIVKDVYEKLAIIAIRNLSHEDKLEIYEILLKKLVNNKGLIQGDFGDIKDCGINLPIGI